MRSWSGRKDIRLGCLRSYYHAVEPRPPYDTIVCISVLNALSRNNSAKVLARIRDLLGADGKAYLAVAREPPRTGKLGVHYSLQNYVVFSLPSIHCDERVEIYEMIKSAFFEDTTKDFISRRDRRRDR